MARRKATPPARVRIKDIADAAGLSVSTVSFVLNGRAAEMRVSDKAVTRVRKAARALGYVPHITARRLRARRTSAEPIVLAIVTSLETPLVLAGPVLRGVQILGAKLQGKANLPLQITIETFHHGALRDLPGLLDGTRFNGAILTNTVPEDDAFLAEARLPVPVVLFNRRVPGYSCVYVDEEAVGRGVAQACQRQSPRHLCLLRPRVMTQAVQGRYDGFLQAADELGLPAPREIISDGLDEFAARQAVLGYLREEEPMDALYALTSVLAVGARVAVRLCGRQPQHDVLLLGEDRGLRALRDRKLTSFDHPSVIMAREAAQLVIDILRTGESMPVQIRFEQDRIVERKRPRNTT